MALEVERKFLLKTDAWRKEVKRSGLLVQGYLHTDPERTVRVRIKNNRGILTIKGLGTGISRPEFEYAIPLVDARALLQLCQQPPIEKTRHEVKVGEHLWEIDEFMGVNEGLVIAEIELRKEQESFVRPLWLGEEVTADKRYYNAALSSTPFSTW
ncbi:MAG: CYTH domain-containing protein [Bacteroidota bacterium]